MNDIKFTCRNLIDEQPKTFKILQSISHEI